MERVPHESEFPIHKEPSSTLNMHTADTEDEYDPHKINTIWSQKDTTLDNLVRKLFFFKKLLDSRLTVKFTDTRHAHFSVQETE